MENYFKGFEQILYIEVSGVYQPIACLTNTSMAESSDVLETTTRDNVGWKTSLPTNQGYALSFDGLAFNSLYGITPTKLSYDRLKFLKRARTIFNWELRTQGENYVEYGQGYIVDISQTAPASSDELISFSGSIVGVGKPFSRSIFEERISWDNTNVTFDTTFVTWDNDIPSSGVGVELVTNGDFATNSDWTLGTGWSISGGQATSDGQVGCISQTVTITPGAEYTFKFSVPSGSAFSDFIQLRLGSTSPQKQFLGIGNFEVLVIAGSDNSLLSLCTKTNGAWIGSIDNVSLKENI